MFFVRKLIRFDKIKINCVNSNVNIREYSKSTTQMMRYLNVAEKNDAAKSIASLLSNGTARRSDGLSVYNKIYSFQLNFRGRQTDMIMTSVSGHLMSHEFENNYNKWSLVDPIELFDAPVSKICPENYVKIKQTLEREV